MAPTKLEMLAQLTGLSATDLKLIAALTANHMAANNCDIDAAFANAGSVILGVAKRVSNDRTAKSSLADVAYDMITTA